MSLACCRRSPDEHGMAMRDPERDAVFIGVARTDHPMRQRSTLAHELGHVIFGDWVENATAEWSAHTPEEDRCRAFARHLLVPIEGLRAFLGEPATVTLAGLSAVVQRFLVSPAIAAIALEQAGYIDAATSQQWAELETPQLATRFGWIDHYRALQADANRRRAPQRLLARAIVGYTEGVVSAQTIATLRQTGLSETESELRVAGIVPKQRSVPWTNADDLPAATVDLAALGDDLDTDESDSANRDAE